MKQTTLAFIIALGFIAPGLATAAHFTGNGNATYERDLTTWNGAGQDIATARLASQKSHFEYNNIYEHDLAAQDSAGQDINATRLATQKLNFEYNNIYKHDLAVRNGASHGSVLSS